MGKSFDEEIDSRTIMNLTEKYYNESNFDKLQEKIVYPLGNLEKNYITTKSGLISMAFHQKELHRMISVITLKNSLTVKRFILMSLKEFLKITSIHRNNFLKKKHQIEYSIVEALIKLFRKQKYMVCNNDLTDITITEAGKEYFREVLYP